MEHQNKRTIILSCGKCNGQMDFQFRSKFSGATLTECEPYTICGCNRQFDSARSCPMALLWEPGYVFQIHFNVHSICCTTIIAYKTSTTWEFLRTSTLGPRSVNDSQLVTARTERGSTQCGSTFRNLYNGSHVALRVSFGEGGHCFSDIAFVHVATTNTR